MNWVDLAIITILVFFVIDSLGRSFLSEVLDLISFILASLISYRFYNFPATFFETQFNIPHGLALVLGFMAIWFVSEVTFFILVGRVVPKIPKSRILHRNYLSPIPAVLKGLIFMAIFLVLIATFPIQPAIKKAVQDSKLGSLILSQAYTLEQPLKQVFGGVANDTLTFLTIEPKTGEKVNLGFKTAEFKIDPATEEAMILLVNKERTSRGLNALTFDSKLRDVGRFHSEDMFRRGYFSHYSPEGQSVANRAEKFGVSYLVIGENLAYAPNLELAHKGLMNSPGHRANILSEDFNKIGIGVLDGGIYGMMFTQVFSD
jgi:uncharacterized protein YkwD